MDVWVFQKIKQIQECYQTSLCWFAKQVHSWLILGKEDFQHNSCSVWYNFHNKNDAKWALASLNQKRISVMTEEKNLL